MRLTSETDPVELPGRLQLRVSGRVQGVGFRPFVVRAARELGLSGAVSNEGEGVLIDAEGSARGLAALEARVRAPALPLALVAGVEVSEWLEPLGRAGFGVEIGRPGRAQAPLVPPDAGPCAECAHEVLLGRQASGEGSCGPSRRRGYPFTSCTNCGPRASILAGLPYARERTALAPFTLCAACQAEYEDPRDRRFHAETQACPACGPRLVLREPRAPRVEGPRALARARSLLALGAIVAVKGVGGWQLVCRLQASSLTELRTWKRRPHKPFAVLVADLCRARELAELSEAACSILSSPARPILICPQRPGVELPGELAPGLTEVGVFLPPSPLHALLAEGQALVVTSANRSGGPILCDDAEAEEVLQEFPRLGHSRQILSALDDSVARISAGAPLLLRRARGYVPEALTLPTSAPRQILALGADLKNTFCLARGDQALVSQHLGDLSVCAVEDRAEALRGALIELLGFEPEVVVSDQHPDFVSTRAAEELGLKHLRVQHHHAHAAAVLAEHGRRGPALAWICDGYGYGSEGAAWGCELFEASLVSCERIGGLRAIPLPGGDATARAPWRSAWAYLLDAGLDASALPGGGEEAALSLLQRWIEGGQAGRSSSLGRLFDAVAALCGLRYEQTWEAQGACELEHAAAGRLGEAYPFPLGPDLQLDSRPLIRALVADRERLSVAERAARFHKTLIEGFARAAQAARPQGGTLVLGGGCFQNRLLLEGLQGALEPVGFEVLVPRRLPPNDGAISFGQAAVAASLLSAGRA